MMHRAARVALGLVLRSSFVGTAFGGVVAAAIVLTGPDASAKSSYDSGYGYDRTWNCALRMVRVDMGFKITEKDDANGYLLFEYKTNESSKTTPGSMEFIRGKEADSPVHVIVQLPQMPKYHEQVLVDDLARKLRQEYGEPPAKRPPPAPIVPDGGADGGI
jgi:hypothetical protein